MNTDNALILAVILMGIIAIYRLWKSPDANKKYVVSAIIGAMMVFGGLPFRHMESPFNIFVYIAGIGGWILAMFSLYMYHKSEKRTKKKRKR